MKPLKIPNLPTTAVKVVITAGGISGLKDSLQKLSINNLETSININLEPGIANHSDLLVYHFCDNKILLSSEQMFLYRKLSELKFHPMLSMTTISSPYPGDVYLNAARLGMFVICNTKTITPEILTFAESNNLEIIHVKQGYTKCSICILNKNTIITEDEGIKIILEKKGIEVLLISKGSIKLNNHQYGFFGGCTGLIDKNKLAIIGNLKYHTDYERINKFLLKHNIQPVSLIDGDLQDIGGIIPIIQMNNDTSGDTGSLII